VCYLLGVSPASGLYWPTFRNILSVPSSRQMIGSDVGRVTVVYLYRRTVSGFVFCANRRAGSVGGGGPRAGTAGINIGRYGFRGSLLRVWSPKRQHTKTRS
jgi:hypothetical protein